MRTPFGGTENLPPVDPNFSERLAFEPVSQFDGSSEILDCAVIGAGPAGMTTALYLRRFHRTVCVLDSGDSRALRISWSNNVAGYPNGIAGRQLLKQMTEHLERVGADIVLAIVVSIERDRDGTFDIRTQTKRYRARTVALCTGVEVRRPDLPGLNAVVDADLLRECPICDGYEHTGKRVGVLGNSPHAVNEAVFLQRFTPLVTFVPVQASNGNVALAQSLTQAKVTTLSGCASHLEVNSDGIVVVTMDDGTIHLFDALYTALGADPRASLASALGARLDEKGGVVVDSHCQTSVPRLFAAGDLTSGLDQIAVAVGQGAVVATAIHNWL